MRKVPRLAIPASFKTPYLSEISFLTSAKRGISKGPSPPIFLGSRVHFLTYEGEVKWIKEKEKPLVLEVIKGKFLELTGGADPRVRFEVRSNFADGGSDDLTGHVRYIINYL